MDNRTGRPRQVGQVAYGALGGAGNWQTRRSDLMQDLFGRFGTRAFSVYEAARPGVLSRPGTQRKYYVGTMAADIRKLTEEGVLAEVPTKGKYPNYRYRTPAEVHASREAAREASKG